MRRYAWIGGAFLIVVLLLVVELTIITNASGYETKEKIVFTKTHIDKNTVITVDMLEIKEVGTAVVHPDALKSLDAAVTRMAGTDIEAGEMLLGAKLSSGENGTIEAEDKSKRLFSVEFDVDQANGWQLANDQLVDIIYVPAGFEEPYQSAVIEVVESNKGDRISEGVNAPESDSATGAAIAPNGGNVPEAGMTSGKGVSVIPASNNIMVLKNIRIAGLIDADGKLVDILKSKNVPRYISFEVTEEQAIFLAYAKRSGKLELSCIPGK